MDGGERVRGRNICPIACSATYLSLPLKLVTIVIPPCALPMLRPWLETCPAELMQAPLVLAFHVVAALVLLNAYRALGTLLGVGH